MTPNEEIQEPSQSSDLQDYYAILAGKSFLAPQVARSNARRFVAGYTMIAGSLLSLLCVYIFYAPHIAPGILLSGCLLLGMLGIGLCILGSLQAEAARRTALGHLLSTTQDTRLIGPLIETHGTQSGEYKVALLRLLPRIQPQDAQSLDESQWRYLFLQIQGGDPQMILAVLTAILHCGNIKALPYVQPLAKGRGLAKRDARIQPLAQACVETLESHIKRLNTQQILLRASSAPAAPENLLRPVKERIDSAPQQLLRASGEHKRGDDAG